VNEQQLSEAIEELLVARNLRQMALARSALEPGYYLRGARHLLAAGGTVIIGTGFPVAGTFETDGPVGAMALYRALQTLGAHPLIACGAPLSRALASHYRVLELQARDQASARTEAREHLRALQPEAVVAIERPGLAGDGRYYNMHGEDISSACHYFDPYISEASCPTIAIGDGGNEIGMGNIADRLRGVDVEVSITRCDELLVADVSNWGAYGLIALLALWSGRDLLQAVSPLRLLRHVSAQGSVDGVTGENTLTEDGLHARAGMRVIRQLRELTNFL
jgi:hypothetical protein